jgi:hypothetical protein
MTREMCGTLSAFYLALWDYLDAFFDDNRWFRAGPSASPEERVVSISVEFRDLLMLNVPANQFAKTVDLADGYLADQLAFKSEVLAWKDTLQALGLEFARLKYSLEGTDG